MLVKRMPVTTDEGVDLRERAQEVPIDTCCLRHAPIRRRRGLSGSIGSLEPPRPPLRL